MRGITSRDFAKSLPVRFQGRDMLPEERRNKILEMLDGSALCSVTEFVERLDVSRITVVRDLTFLEKAGIVTKVHGGAKLRNENRPHYEALFKIRMNRNIQKKQIIGREAALLPKDDSTIFVVLLNDFLCFCA